MRFKRIGVGVLTIGVSVGIVGCGAQNTSTSSQSSSKVVEITMSIQAAGNSSKALQQAVNAFNKENPGIHVTTSFYGTETAYDQALQAKIAGGVAPDVFWVDAPYLSKYVSDNVLMPLNAVIHQTHFPVKTFSPALLKAFTVGNKLYAIPKDYNVSALFYNETMLAKAHVTPPHTWTQLDADAKALTKKGVWGFGMYPQLNYFYPFIASAGGTFVHQSGLKGFNSPAQTKALVFFAKMFAQKVAVTPQMIGASWDGAMFAKGSVAMLYSGSWIPASTPNIKVGVLPVPIPNASDTPISWSYTAGWGISATSKHAQADMKFIRFMESPHELVSGFKNGFDGLPPTTNGMQALISANPQIAPELKQYQKIVDHSVSFGWAHPNFVNAYNTMLQFLASNPSQNVAHVLSTFEKQQNLK